MDPCCSLAVHVLKNVDVCFIYVSFSQCFENGEVFNCVKGLKVRLYVLNPKSCC